ncbi:MAG: DUF4160 domain-containing protein [Gallionellaceae bacterium]
MPEISRFLAILILMHFREQNPAALPCQIQRASLTIESLELTEGKLPPRVLSLVIEWASEHQAELLKNWNALRLTDQFHRIAPLV